MSDPRCKCGTEPGFIADCPVHGLNRPMTDAPPPARPETPEPMNAGQTHWDGCWRERGHHNCAVALCASQSSEIARLREDAEELRQTLAPGTLPRRYAGLIAELTKRFPEADQPYSSFSCEPRFLAAIDALLAARSSGQEGRAEDGKDATSQG